MLPQDSLDSESHTVTLDEAQRELEAVLRSPAFERSERLQRFLRYICELTLRGESARINEYLIGSEVFRKGPDYSPHVDSIVRRQAHTLRQKLQEYYSGEGADHTVHIELPVGRYVPAFRRVENKLTASLPVLDAESAVVPKRSTKRFLAGIAASAGLAFVAGWFLGRGDLWKRAAERSTNSMPAAVKEIWAPWLRDNREIVVCFSNPMTAVFKHFAEPLAEDALPRRFKADPEETLLLRKAFNLPPGGHIYYTPAANQGKMGEAFAAVNLSSFFSAAGHTVTATQSRFLSWEDLRKQNLVLMGHDEANQWIDPLLKKYPFRLTRTSAKEQRSIVNTSPRVGEPASYAIAYSDDDSAADEEYALISMLPGIDGDFQLLLISGLNAQATQIATEYLTKERSVTELAGELHKRDPQHRGQWYFQAVLKTEVYDKVPMRATLVNLRVIRQ